MITKKLYYSFKYAFSGLWFCIKNERNFRVHIFAALTVCLFAPYYNFSVTQKLLLAFIIALVIICEMFNTAIEAAIDLTVDEYNSLAKKAKDVSAGAVLVAAICSLLFGLFLFLKLEVILIIISDIINSPIKIIGLIIYIIIGYLFVRGVKYK